MQVMKFFLASFLIFLFSSLSLCSTSVAQADYVSDIQGIPVTYGSNYTMTAGPLCGKVNVLPRNGTCRIDIIQDYFRTFNGTYFTFSPNGNTSSSETALRIGATVAISISPSKPSLCSNSSIWKVSNTLTRLITNGGALNTSSSCFRLVRPANPVVAIYTYIIEHCPFLCSGGNDTCYPVGIYETSDGIKHLSSNRPYLELVLERNPFSAPLPPLEII